MNRTNAMKITISELSVILGETVDDIWTYYEDKMEYVLEKDFVEYVYEDIADDVGEKGYVESHWISYKDLEMKDK